MTTPQSQLSAAGAIVEHLEQSKWKIDQGPVREGHGPGLIGERRAERLGLCAVNAQKHSCGGLTFLIVPAAFVGEAADMALAKYYEDIIERRGENRARIEFEYQCPQNVRPTVPNGRKPRADAFVPLISREEVIALREWNRRALKEWEERSSREKVVLFELNEQRQVVKVSYLTKGEAAELTGVGGGELLSLDSYYGGIVSCFGYIFASDDLVADGLRRYGANVAPVALMNALIDEIKERRAAA